MFTEIENICVTKFHHFGAKISGEIFKKFSFKTGQLDNDIGLFNPFILKMKVIEEKSTSGGMLKKMLFCWQMALCSVGRGQA